MSTALPTFRRSQADELLRRLRGPRRFIQAIAGPRQVGKTTLALQVLDELGGPSRYASADEPALRGRDWLVRLESSTSARGRAS